MSNKPIMEEKLERLLQTLKQNKENVPLETLKTYYAEPYKALTEDIRTTLSAYVKAIVCDGLPIDISDVDEAVTIINTTVEKSGIMKFISSAAFKNYDMKRACHLSITLRTLVTKALLPLVDRYTYYWLYSDDMNAVPFPYNTVLDCFLIEDAWVMLDHNSRNLSCLLYTS